MTFRQMIGLIILSIGVVTVVFAFHTMGLIEKRHQVTRLTDSPLSPTEHFPEIVSEPHPETLWIIISGISFVLVGGCMTVRFRT